MTPRQDPYRVLGLVPGATAGEIRSAYRRLAKLNHPDTAGERSLPRFLAIQAAYEELVDGEGRLRGRGWPGRASADGQRPSPSAGTSSAHRASRDGWRARQAGSARGGGPARPGASADGGGRRSEASGTRGHDGGAGANGGARPDGAGAGARWRERGAGTGARPGTRQGPKPQGGGQRAAGQGRPERRTARPGSTTYDEAAQPLDPSWEGGAWYGASSGRYWTLNPREYADPRKHGPEYQERARRAVRQEGTDAPPPRAMGSSRDAAARDASNHDASGLAGGRASASSAGSGHARGDRPGAEDDAATRPSAPSPRLVWRSRRRPAP